MDPVDIYAGDELRAAKGSRLERIIGSRRLYARRLHESPGGFVSVEVELDGQITSIPIDEVEVSRERPERAAEKKPTRTLDTPRPLA